MRPGDRSARPRSSTMTWDITVGDRRPMRVASPRSLPWAQEPPCSSELLPEVAGGAETGGFPWSPLTDGQCALTTGAVTVDPVNPNIVYVGTGEYNPSPDPTSGCGVLKSVDGGSSWALTQQAPFAKTGGGYMAFSRILVDPGSAGSTSSVVYATGELGIFRSTNSGATWTKVLTGSTSSLVVHPTKPATLFAGNSDLGSTRQRGVYRSTDNGVTWAPLPPFPILVNAGIGRIEIANSPAAP